MKRLALLFAVLVIAGIGAACDEIPAAAATVNGERISQSTVDDDLQEIRDNDDLEEVVTQSGQELARTPGTIDSQLTASWLTLLVQGEIADQELADLDVEVTDADRDAAEQSAQTFFGTPEAFEAFSEAFQDDFVDMLAGIVALQTEFADDQAALVEVLTSADVDVNPRYGTWSTEGDPMVVPPART
jgi:hypothetical protein